MLQESCNFLLQSTAQHHKPRQTFNPKPEPKLLAQISSFSLAAELPILSSWRTLKWVTGSLVRKKPVVLGRFLPACVCTCRTMSTVTHQCHSSGESSHCVAPAVKTAVWSWSWTMSRCVSLSPDCRQVRRNVSSHYRCSVKPGQGSCM